MPFRTRYIFAAVSLVLGLVPPTAPAQPMDAGGDEFAGIEEVIVTARRREERLQETPIAITAFSADGLEQRNVQNVSEVAQFTPNLIFNTTANIAASNSIAVVYIRGVGQDDFTMAIDPGVGIYLDGVYIARSMGSVLEALDFERVEVLRGPQGTLFGRNTIGGAISITTRKPGHELAGRFSAEFGESDTRYFSGFVDVPITEDLSTSFSFLSRQRDGYVKALEPGLEDFGDEDKLAGRFAMRWTPTDTFEFSLSVDGTEQREQAAPLSLIAVNEDALFATLYNQSVGPACFPVVDRSNPLCYSGYFVAAPYATYASYRTDNDLINNDIPLPVSPQTVLDVWGISATAAWEINDSVTLKSITAYRETESEFSRDADQSPVPLVQTVTASDYDQFSQELQALGTAMGGRLNWILGFYYFEESGGMQDVVEFFQLPLRSGGHYDNDSYAGFGQATFDFTDRWSATAGIRYTKDRKRYAPDQIILGENIFGIPPGLPLVPPDEVRNFSDDWTPYLNLAFRPAEGIMLYASYSEGFKGGGFTQRVFPPLPEVPQHRPETVEVYEAGFKSEWLGNRIRLNGAVFHNDYTDVQVLVNRGVAPVTENAATARIRGFEFELTAAPTDRLTLDASVGYLDAEYRELDPAAIAAGLSLDKEFANTPEWTASAGADYLFDLGGRGTLRPRVDWSHSGGVYRDAVNSPLLYQDSYDIVTASLNYESQDGLWLLSLIAENLTDETYILSGQDQTPLVGNAEAVYARPRIVTFRVTRRF